MVQIQLRDCDYAKQTLTKVYESAS
jgi:hypothetical protein